MLRGVQLELPGCWLRTIPDYLGILRGRVGCDTWDSTGWTYLTDANYHFLPWWRERDTAFTDCLVHDSLVHIHWLRMTREMVNWLIPEKMESWYPTATALYARVALACHRRSSSWYAEANHPDRLDSWLTSCDVLLAMPCHSFELFTMYPEMREFCDWLIRLRWHI